MKTLTDAELKEIILYFNINLKRRKIDIPAKGSKKDKIKELCKLFGINGDLKEEKKTMRKAAKNPKS